MTGEAAEGGWGDERSESPLTLNVKGIRCAHYFFSHAGRGEI